jgi:hypothetical protein
LIAFGLIDVDPSIVPTAGPAAGRIANGDVSESRGDVILGLNGKRAYVGAESVGCAGGGGESCHHDDDLVHGAPIGVWRPRTG